MGVLSGKDVYNSKFITAEIADSSNRLHFVPIKHELGDYFLAVLDGQMYAFKIDGSRILTYRQTFAKSFKVLRYDTSHYKPVSAANSELELILKKNGLPRLNRRTLGLLKLIGKREKKGEIFTPIKLKEALEEIAKHEESYSEEVRILTNYLTHLNLEQIVTPVRGITEFIEDDLIATDAGFLGNIIPHFERTDIEHKKITNTPMGPRKAWAKIMLIILIAGVGITAGYLAYEQGVFDQLGSFIPTFDFVPPPAIVPNDVMKKYPDPEKLREAIANGDIKYSDLPPEVQKLVN